MTYSIVKHLQVSSTLKGDSRETSCWLATMAASGSGVSSLAAAELVV